MPDNDVKAATWRQGGGDTIAVRLCWTLVALAALGVLDPSLGGDPQVADAVPASDEISAADQTADEALSPPGPFDLRRTPRLTGDWGGARSWLEDRGVSLALSMTNIYQHDARGGVQTRHAHSVTGSYDLELTLDFDAMKLWKGGTVDAYAEGSWGDGISDRGYVGDLFGVNADAAPRQEIQLSELWYEHAFLDDKLRVRFGKLYLTDDFDTNAFANDWTTQFLNYGLNNTANIPFPDYALGVQAFAKPADWLYLGAAAVDAEGNGVETGLGTAFHGRDDFFSIYEFGLTPTLAAPWGKLPGSYRLGLWYDPRPKPEFFNDLGGRLRNVPTKRDDLGFYGSFDQVLLPEDPQNEEDEQGFGLFCRYGYAHKDANEIEHFWSVGGQYQGLVPTRDEDVLAFGAAQGILSEELRHVGMDPHRETVLELYYNAVILPWLSVAPDFQWILRPGGEDGRDAFVAGLRMQVMF